jgi:hypothetical protein
VRKLSEEGYGDVGENYGAVGVGIMQLLRQLKRCQNLGTMHGLHTETCTISGFRREVDENCALLGYYAASSGNLFPAFPDNVSVQS